MILLRYFDFGIKDCKFRLTEQPGLCRTVLSSRTRSRIGICAESSRISKVFVQNIRASDIQHHKFRSSKSAHRKSRFVFDIISSCNVYLFRVLYIFIAKNDQRRDATSYRASLFFNLFLSKFLENKILLFYFISSFVLLFHINNKFLFQRFIRTGKTDINQ